MPFTVVKAELDRYAAGLPRAVELDLRGALAWFGADEEGPVVRVSRHDLQQSLHYTLRRQPARGCMLTERGRTAVLCARRARALRPPPPPLPPRDPPPSRDLIAQRAGVALPPVPGGAPPHLDPADEDDRAELIRLAHPELAAAIDAGEEDVVVDGEAVNPRLHLPPPLEPPPRARDDRRARSRRKAQRAARRRNRR